jgi:hypothetical protein
MDITKLENCPSCNANWVLSLIPQESIDKGYYSPDSKFFSRVFGVEYLGTDRCHHYQCPDCHQCWDRKGRPIDSKDEVVVSSLR